jgi:hypothetical protein
MDRVTLTTHGESSRSAEETQNHITLNMDVQAIKTTQTMVSTLNNGLTVFQ